MCSPRWPSAAWPTSISTSSPSNICTASADELAARARGGGDPGGGGDVPAGRAGVSARAITQTSGMNIVITGGAGFLGTRLARTLLAAGSIVADGQAPRPISRITLLDLVPPPADLAGDPR